MLPATAEKMSYMCKWFNYGCERKGVIMKLKKLLKIKDYDSFFYNLFTLTIFMLLTGFFKQNLLTIVLFYGMGFIFFGLTRKAYNFLKKLIVGIAYENRNI